MRNIIGKKEAVSLMEPLMPEESLTVLDDLALDLTEKAHRLAGQIHPVVQASLAHLIRSMNCYYSNLIEGHDTHPRDIERALAQNFSSQPKQRALQLEAKAHIEVQKMIDEASEIPNPVSTSYICQLHREFCSRLPEAMLWVEDPDTKRKVKVLPGQLRSETVTVGRHIPPRPDSLVNFLLRFEEVYQPDSLTKLRRILAVAASHHRLLWIHPFFDGNGRVARLFSHAYLKCMGLGSGLWSVSRGLARSVAEYRLRLEAADAPRSNDLDGRGNLSAQGLIDFCRYFLSLCVDQVDYMGSLLDPAEFLRRVEFYSEDEIRAKRLPKGCFSLLREAWLMGQFERGKASEITNYGPRQASTILNELIKKDLLTSDSPKGPVRLGFPLEVVERWFPSLYPAKSIANPILTR